MMSHHIERLSKCKSVCDGAKGTNFLGIDNFPECHTPADNFPVSSGEGSVSPCSRYAASGRGPGWPGAEALCGLAHRPPGAPAQTGAWGGRGRRWTAGRGNGGAVAAGESSGRQGAGWRGGGGCSVGECSPKRHSKPGWGILGVGRGRSGCSGASTSAGGGSQEHPQKKKNQ